MKKIIWTVLISSTLILSFAVADYVVNSDFAVVKTKTVAKQTVVKYIKANGTVKEQNKREISVELPFRIDEIYIEVGDEVSKDEKLLRLNKEILKNKMELDLSYKSETNDNLIAKIENYNNYVTSPINGIVTKIDVKEGDTVNINSPVAVISDLDNLLIKAQVPENLIADIFLGQKVIVKGKSFTGQIEGSVSKIYPIAEKNNDYTSQSYITVDVKSDGLKNLKPETSVSLEFEKENKGASIIVPFDSVMFDEETPYVFINKYGYAVKRYVNLGEEYETDVEILNGISTDDDLILNPKSQKIIHGNKIVKG